MDANALRFFPARLTWETSFPMTLLSIRTVFGAFFVVGGQKVIQFAHAQHDYIGFCFKLMWHLTGEGEVPHKLLKLELMRKTMSTRCSQGRRKKPLILLCIQWQHRVWLEAGTVTTTSQQKRRTRNEKVCSVFVVLKAYTFFVFEYHIFILLCVQHSIPRKRRHSQKKKAIGVFEHHPLVTVSSSNNHFMSGFRSRTISCARRTFSPIFHSIHSLIYYYLSELTVNYIFVLLIQLRMCKVNTIFI